MMMRRTPRGLAVIAYGHEPLILATPVRPLPADPEQAEHSGPAYHVVIVRRRGA